MVKVKYYIILLLILNSCSEQENTYENNEKQNQPTEIPLNIFNPYTDYLRLKGNVKYLDIYFLNQDPSYRNERFEFDDNNNVVRYFINYDSLTKESSFVEINSYDSLGRIISSKKRQLKGISNDSLIETTKYHYDVDYPIIEWTSDINGVVSKFETIGIIEQDKVTYQTVDSNFENVSMFQLDVKGNKIYSEQNTDHTEYLYDNSARLINKKQFRADKIFSYVKNVYSDSDNFPDLIIFKSGAHDSITHKIDYDFDSVGNWILKSTNSSDNVWGEEYKVIRKFTYKK